MSNGNVNELYNKLATSLKEISYLRGISGLLEWDQNTFIPENANEVRGKQMGALAGVVHEKQTSPELGSLIDTLVSHPDLSNLNQHQRAVVRDAKRNYDMEAKIPKEMAQRAAELNSKGYTVWTEARSTNNFSLFAPVLKEWIQLLKDKAKCIDPSKNPYDVLLDCFERGVTSARIDEIFSKLKPQLITLIEKIKQKPTPDNSFLKGFEYDNTKQKELSHSIAIELGFDITSGRLDESVHPFTGGSHPTDVRMTTRYKKDDFIEGLSGTVHETGHSIYEQGRNKEYIDLPVSEALSMGTHESQSLLYERMVFLSRAFWKRYWGKIKETFPGIKASATEEDIYKAVNIVTPSLIRVEADEVTYPLHVILRYELEKGLIEGTIDVDQLPTLWNQKMKDYLGVVPPSDKEGVLQDVHWSGGALGYFPTYTLGAIYACQFFHEAKKQVNNLQDSLEKGDFKPLKEWLNKNIHEIGSLYPSGDELAQVVTGRPLDVDLFINYLNEKYKDIYSL